MVLTVIFTPTSLFPTCEVPTDIVICCFLFYSCPLSYYRFNAAKSDFDPLGRVSFHRSITIHCLLSIHITVNSIHFISFDTPIILLSFDPVRHDEEHPDEDEGRKKGKKGRRVALWNGIIPPRRRVSLPLSTLPPSVNRNDESKNNEASRSASAGGRCAQTPPECVQHILPRRASAHTTERG